MYTVNCWFWRLLPSNGDNVKQVVARLKLNTAALHSIFHPQNSLPGSVELPSLIHFLKPARR